MEKNCPDSCVRVSSERQSDGKKSLLPAWDQSLGVKQAEHLGLGFWHGFVCGCIEALLHSYCRAWLFYKTLHKSSAGFSFLDKWPNFHCYLKD